MTVIHTTEDLVRLLDENDEFRQAVRRHILTDELLQLPERLAGTGALVGAFVADQRQFNQEQKRSNQRTETAAGELQAGVARNSEAIGKLRGNVAGNTEAIGELRGEVARNSEAIGELRGNVARNTEAISELRGEVVRNTEAIDELSGSVARQTDAIGELRGNAARQVASTHFQEIADGMGFQFKRLLARQDLVKLLLQSDHDDLERGDRHSFFRADLVMEATDRDGATHYIAVEASYTADQRDTNRARRNAALLERFTGQRAHAAVASVRNVHEIQGLIDEGTVSWYALEPDDFTPD